MNTVKKITAIILLAVILATAFIGCNKNDIPDETTGDTTTTEEITTEEVTTARPNYSELQYTGKVVINNKDIGMRVATCVNSNPYIVDTEITRTSIVLYCYMPGTATLELTDYFERTAKITVTVKESTGAENENKKELISTEIDKCKTEIIEVADFGAKGNGSTDDTKAFQAAIDSASPGDTVYVYPGRYNVSLLTMREGVTLKMYTEMTDAKVGYTKEIALAVNQSRYAILSGTRILNNKNEAKGAEGCSNFSIIGGVIDTNITTRSTLIFGCADNVRVENVIFKDIKGNHTIQFTGCTNSVIENCMFAGYECGDTFTREVIQLEPSTPGATGGPLTFADGEYNCPKNITINNCYFGKSDEAGAPLMAIGHHSQVGEANVTGLKITNNVFDEVLYAAIRYNNLVDVEITGNTFISTSKYMNATQFSQATTPAFIILYLHSGSSTYTASNGLKVTEALASEQAGHHNIKIENNTFNIGAGSDKRVIYYAPQSYLPGVSFVSCTRQDKYDSPTYSFAGYSVNRNYLENLSFSNNTVTFEGQPQYKTYYIRLSNVFGLKMEGNKINLNNGTSFTTKMGDYENGQFISSIDTTKEFSYIINTKSTDKSITVIFGDKTYKLLANFTGSVTLKKGEGGIIESETDEKGNLTVKITPAEGYSLGKITDSASNELKTGLSVLTTNTLYNISFTKN